MRSINFENDFVMIRRKTVVSADTMLCSRPHHFSTIIHLSIHMHKHRATKTMKYIFWNLIFRYRIYFPFDDPLAPTHANDVRKLVLKLFTTQTHLQNHLLWHTTVALFLFGLFALSPLWARIFNMRNFRIIPPSFVYLCACLIYVDGRQRRRRQNGLRKW